MKRNPDPSGVVIFLIVALPIVIGAVIGILTYQPPKAHATGFVNTAYVVSIGG